MTQTEEIFGKREKEAVANKNFNFVSNVGERSPFNGRKNGTEQFCLFCLTTDVESLSTQGRFVNDI